ncbi:MAG: hypothetical protein AAF702_25930 [Chloroflexota bacterium]
MQKTLRINAVSLFILLLAACFDPPKTAQTTPIPDLSHLTADERRIAQRFDILQNTNYTGKVCAKYELGILRSLTELAALPNAAGMDRDALMEIFANATTIQIDELWMHERGFLIGLHGCRIGSPSHSRPNTAFYLVQWQEKAETLGWGIVVDLQQQGDQWFMLLDTKGSSQSGPTPHRLWLIDWQGNSWNKVTLTFDPIPYGRPEILLANKGKVVTILVNYWHGTRPCTLTTAFTEQFFLATWEARLTYEVTPTQFLLKDREILSWDLMKDGKTYTTITDWQQYCVEPRAVQPTSLW